jgi:hypothetical protein
MRASLPVCSAGSTEEALRFYEVQYRDALEIVATYAVHAADPVSAIASAHAFFEAHPNHDPRRGRIDCQARILEKRQGGGYDAHRT